MKKYTWRESARIKGVSAQAAGETLDRIAARDGSVTPAAVVDEARPKDSPIHSCFEWRDKVAAEAHRKYQARHLIRSVRVVDAVTKSETPGFVHVRAASEYRPGAYYRPDAVVKDLDLFERAISEAEAKLVAARRSVEELKNLAAETNHKDKLAAISLAAASLANATSALNSVH
ncbi:MAG: hypothetical protein ACOC00_07650 [Halothiobacillaceae bacterium]